jgi:hypothetical protein
MRRSSLCRSKRRAAHSMRRAAPGHSACNAQTTAVGAAFTQRLYGCGGPQSVPPVARGRCCRLHLLHLGLVQHLRLVRLNQRLGVTQRLTDAYTYMYTRARARAHAAIEGCKIPLGCNTRQRHGSLAKPNSGANRRRCSAALLRARACDAHVGGQMHASRQARSTKRMRACRGTAGARQCRSFRARSLKFPLEVSEAPQPLGSAVHRALHVLPWRVHACAD